METSNLDPGDIVLFKPQAWDLWRHRHGDGQEPRHMERLAWWELSWDYGSTTNAATQTSQSVAAGQRTAHGVS